MIDEIMRPPKVGSPFHGNHRAARVQRFRHKNLTTKAQRRKKARRKSQRVGRRAARR